MEVLALDLLKEEAEIIDIINNSFMPETMKKKAIYILKDRIQALRIED